ncbi:MAG: creatininase family protein [Proteobacteria bacterium]|nr:creatininase family protein [Pseudomonadota bacterium]
MQLQLSTWPEVEKHLERESGIIIPIGSTEQHGPNGLIGTDAICPETIARGVGEQSGALVAPTLNVGMAQHHMAFAGSMTLRPSTLIAVIKDVVDSLARHGFDRFYFLNGHGGNIATLSSAFSEIHTERSLGTGAANSAPVRCKTANWWMGPKVRTLAKKLFGDAEGSHATPSEVSLSFYAHPEAVKSAEMSPRIAPRGGFHGAEDYRRRFPDGRIGSDPSLASVEAGEKLYLAALDEIAADYQAFLVAD